MKELRVALIGEGAELGAVPAADIAQLILGIEKAVFQAAAVALGKPKITSGRYARVIEETARFRLRGVERGSVVPVLELPEPSVRTDDPGFDMEVATLGETAVSIVLDAVTLNSANYVDPFVARALLDVADKLRLGDRYDAIALDAAMNGRRRRSCVDAAGRKRLRAYVESASAAPARADDLTGVLVEADFEKRTARLRTPTASGVEVSFSEDQDEDIYAALRQPTTVRGDVEFDPRTHSAKAVRLTQLVMGEQLVLGLDPRQYWAEESFESLARAQDAGRPVDPDELYAADATEEESNAFMAALAELG